MGSAARHTKVWTVVVGVAALMVLGSLSSPVWAGEDLGRFCFKIGTFDDQLFLGATAANEMINISVQWDGLTTYRLYGAGAGGESSPLQGMWQLGLAVRNDSP